MNQDTGKPNRFKIALGCFVAVLVFGLLTAVVVTLGKQGLAYLEKQIEAEKAEKAEAEARAKEALKTRQIQEAQKKQTTRKRENPLTQGAPATATQSRTSPDTATQREVKAPVTDPAPLKVDALPENVELVAPPQKREPVAGQLPPLLGLDTKGTLVDLGIYKGKVVLVDFWATWCDPYVRSLPRLKEAYSKYHAQGFDIVGVCLNDDPMRMSAFARKNGMTWRQINASDGYESPLVLRWKVTDLPTAFIIGKDGKIVQAGVSAENLARLIEAELKR